METKGYSLEKLDAIFADVYEKKENPVFTERNIRNGKPLAVEKYEEGGRERAEHRERRSGSGTTLNVMDEAQEKYDPEDLEMPGAAR